MKRMRWLCFVAIALVPTAVLAHPGHGASSGFHGHAQGSELPYSADPATCLGLVLATILLRLVGIGIGKALRSLAQPRVAPEAS